MQHVLEAESSVWLADCFDGLTTELEILTPSEWAEKKRYLPASVTPLPGKYNFGIAPYLIEIADCLSPYSPIREIDVLKGVQTCFTVGVIENGIGYVIDYIKDSPSMFLTADAELAKLRIEQYITPMLTQSDLDHLIKSSDEKNTRKTGKTDKKIEWEGGGWLVPFGAQNANKLRSISVRYLFEDEIDAYPDKVGKDGDPLKLAQDRTASFEDSRKIVRGSTPLVTQTSKAWREYQKGDQREYRVPCKHCGEKQKMVWHGVNEDGTFYGMYWKTDDNNHLVTGSVRYICKFCQGEWINDDKTWMYRQRGKFCEWVPTATPVSPDRRSYHISALYSPVGMQTWEAQVRKFLDAWDTTLDKVKDIEAYRQFRNNVEGLPFEERGESLKFEKVRENRSMYYKSGIVPNKLAIDQANSRILFITAAVDVHKTHLDVLVVGFCKNKIQYAIDWFKIEGKDCQNKEDKAWGKLEKFIDEKVYESDDGAAYRPVVTLVDSQYASEVVYEFCNMYDLGVWAIAGRERPTKNQHYKVFGEFDTKIGSKAFFITVDHYKDKLNAKLKQEWSGLGFQYEGQINYPSDFTDEFFKELTKEQRVQVIDAKTGKFKGFIWKRPSSSSPNHAWDLSVYNSAALDMVAMDFSKSALERDYIVWDAFWQHAETGVYTIKGSFE